ncbi:MAG: hypothetical protein JSU75_09105 [Gammaproteobacteria bacterium]|nr:MAG: hypothetical protein JSU75_09105 [Gammaproteobacteria bacterium]
MRPAFLIHCIASNCRPALLILAILFQTGCTTVTGGRTLDVDTRDLVGVQYMPQEISRMLEALGYEWLPVHDPDIGHPVKVAEYQGQYRMLFQARDNTAIRVEAHIRVAGNHTGLHFYEVGNRELGEAARGHYRKLKQRLVLEFGADNVTEKHPLLAP